MISTFTHTGRFARVAIVAMAVVAVAGCSSSSSKSDAVKAQKVKPAASSTTTAPALSNTPSPTGSVVPTGSASCTTAAAQPVLSPDIVNSITCDGIFAAGAANNTHVDYAYLLQDVNGSWQRASNSVQNAVCTTNPQHLPASFVALACND